MDKFSIIRQITKTKHEKKRIKQISLFSGKFKELENVPEKDQQQ